MVKYWEGMVSIWLEEQVSGHCTSRMDEPGASSDTRTAVDIAGTILVVAGLDGSFLDNTRRLPSIDMASLGAS